MTKERISAAASVVTALALVALVFVGLSSIGKGEAPAIEPPPAPPAAGVSNFDSLTLSDDLNVGGDADVTGSITVGSSDLYPLGSATDGQAVYAASGLITQTLVVTESAHALSTITSAFCQLNQAPSAAATSAAYCVPIVSGTTVTVTLYQDDFVTAVGASDSAQTSYEIIGTP
jgi:hypothetical protein